MSCVIIYPGLPLPAASSDLPENVTGRHIVFAPVLLRMGFTCAPAVASGAVVSYTALPPLPSSDGGSFLLHCPWSRLRRTLSGILPCEARTFLTWRLSALPAAITYSTYRAILAHLSSFVHETFHLPAKAPSGGPQPITPGERSFRRPPANNPRPTLFSTAPQPLPPVESFFQQSPPANNSRRTLFFPLVRNCRRHRNPV